MKITQKIVVALCISSVFCSSAIAENTISYDLVKSETPTFFEYTTTIQAKDISWAVPIELPDVSKIPIVRLRWKINDVNNSETDVIAAGDASDLPSHDDISYMRFTKVEQQADHSEVLPSDARAALENLCLSYDGEADIRFFSQYATTGLYAVSAQKAIDEYNYTSNGNAVNGYEQGLYILRGRQYISDIPIFFSSYFHISNINDPNDPSPDIILYYMNSQNYTMDIRLVEEMDTLIENTGLVPFSKISDTIAMFIDMGILYELDKIELGYMLYYENDVSISTPPSECRLLSIPTWIIYGSFSDTRYFGETTTYLSTSDNEHEIQVLRKERSVWGGDCMRIDATNGEFIDMWADPAPRIYNYQGEK